MDFIKYNRQSRPRHRTFPFWPSERSPFSCQTMRSIRTRDQLVKNHSQLPLFVLLLSGKKKGNTQPEKTVYLQRNSNEKCRKVRFDNLKLFIFFKQFLTMNLCWNVVSTSTECRELYPGMQMWCLLFQYYKGNKNGIKMVGKQ